MSGPEIVRTRLRLVVGRHVRAVLARAIADVRVVRHHLTGPEARAGVEIECDHRVRCVRRGLGVRVPGRDVHGAPLEIHRGRRPDARAGRAPQLRALRRLLQRDGLLLDRVRLPETTTGDWRRTPRHRRGTCSTDSSGSRRPIPRATTSERRVVRPRASARQSLVRPDACRSAPSTPGRRSPHPPRTRCPSRRRSRPSHRCALLALADADGRAHAGGSSKRPVNAATRRVERVHEASIGADEHAAADDDRLARTRSCRLESRTPISASTAGRPPQSSAGAGLKARVRTGRSPSRSTRRPVTAGRTDDSRSGSSSATHHRSPPIPAAVLPRTRRPRASRSRSARSHIAPSSRLSSTPGLLRACAG